MSDSDGSDSVSVCSMEEVGPVINAIYTRNWSTIPTVLSKATNAFKLPIHIDRMMEIPEDKLYTMDGVSKCWKSIPNTSESLLHQEPDGITWAICEECVTSIPLEIQHALYFFHSLQAHVQDYSMFAVESENIIMKHDRKKHKTVRKLLWSRNEKASSAVNNNMQEDYVDMNVMMQERSTYQDGNITSEISPLKIRVGFTDVSFKKQGVLHKKIYCILFITFARNFDALEYIKEVFLKEPHSQESNYQRKHSVYTEMNLLWKRMIRFVAFDNLGLNESIVGKPENYSDDPGGVLGVDSLMNLFQIPFQIHGSVRQSFRADIRDSVVLTDFKIGGFPILSFKYDEPTNDYVAYMHLHVDHIGKSRAQLTKAIQRAAQKEMQKAKKSKEDDDPAVAEVEEIVQLFCVGAWPLHYNAENKFDCWGLPMIPIYLNFEPEFSPDIFGNFDFWIVEAGGPSGIPELIKACLRFYMVSVETGEEEAGSQINWDHFLFDSRIANPSLVLQKYYGEKADPMSALVVAGHLRTWWSSLISEFKSERSSGVSVLVIAGKLSRYLDSVILHHQSSVHCNAYRSDRIVQAVQIVDKLAFDPIAKTGEASILHQFNVTRGKMDFCRQHDSYQVANELFWRTWEDLNHSFKMNSSNLSFLVEMMISQIFWMMGEHNETWAAYFQGIQIKCGNGHYRITTKDGTVNDQRKPNSSGMDWTHARVTQLFQVILDRFGCADSKHNLQTPVNCLSWTPASIPLLTNATICDGKIDTLPDPMVCLRSVIATEVRDVAIGPMIGNFPRNSEGTEQLKFNTCDPENTNKRKPRVQVKVSPLQVVALSTNVSASSVKEDEQYNTLSAVIATMVPGSGPHNKKQRTGGFNNQTCNTFGGRQNRPDNMDSIANIISYSNIWITCMGALINKSAAVPWEINPAVLSYLDWIFFFVKEHLDGILDRFVLQSFRRMKEGYESRQVAKSVWTNAIKDLALCENKHQAVSRNLKNLHVHALPVTEVPGAVHSFLCRGIHMGSCLMVVVCAKHLLVPIIPINYLVDIFNNDKPLTATHKQYMTMINGWIRESSDRNKFCFDENEKRTCYITSDGDAFGNPLNDKICMLRVKTCRVQHNNVAHAIGVRVKDLYGSELNETCHMGPETSIYGNAIASLLQDWSPDFRQLYGNSLYANQKHLQLLQLLNLFPDISDWVEDDVPAFAKVFPIRDHTQEVISYALGLNMWGLLLMAAMGATTLHPHVVSDISRTLIKDILEKTPMAATPGNVLLVRSFQLHTTSPQRILVSNKNRPRHFPRPVGDLSFATTGVFTYAKNVDKYMPEDVMHCGFLFSLAKTLCCSIYELPGRVVPSDYEVMSDTHYAVWNCLLKRNGCLHINHSVRLVTLYVMENNEAFQWNYEEWADELRALDFIMLPMIFRSGACVKQEDNTLGLIVPWDDSGCNYNPEEGEYLYITGENKATTRISAMKTLELLVPVGTELYLDMNSPSGSVLGDKVPRAQTHLQYLVVRLNTPSVLQPEVDKVYVTYLQRPTKANANVGTFSSMTITVNVWELLTVLPPETEFISALLM